MLDRVFDAAERDVVQRISSDSHDEKIADALVEDELWGQTRVAAGYNHRKRGLAIGYSLAPVNALVFMPGVTAGETNVAFDQFFKG